MWHYMDHAERVCAECNGIGVDESADLNQVFQSGGTQHAAYDGMATGCNWGKSLSRLFGPGAILHIFCAG